MNKKFKLGEYYISGFAIAAVMIILDQLSKIAILKYLEEGAKSIPLAPFLNFSLVWNRGISFGMFNGEVDYKWFLIAISLIMSIGLSIWLLQVREKWLGLSLALIIGGALGNVIDRLRLGAVVDFIDLYCGQYHWPAFNIADSCIAIGAFIMLLITLTDKEVKNEK